MDAKCVVEMQVLLFQIKCLISVEIAGKIQMGLSEGLTFYFFPQMLPNVPRALQHFVFISDFQHLSF